MSGNKPRNFDEKQIFTDEEIRDTNTHTSEIIHGGDYNVFTVFVDNQLDEDVTVQIYSNRSYTTTKALNVGLTWIVSATDQEAKTITVDNNGWLPYMFITVVASSTPTSGNLNAYILKR